LAVICGKGLAIIIGGVYNTSIGGELMSLTKEDLQAIGALMDGKLEPMKADINDLKEGLEGVRTSQLKVESEQYRINADINDLKESLEGVRTSQLKVESEQYSIKADVNDLKEGLEVVRTSQLKVELEQYPRIAAALDGVISGIEKNKEQDKRITALENIAEDHAQRVFVLEQMSKAR
jgi:chromosome segregation ATPase